MTTALLFIDLLGVRARWHRGGRPEAEKAFQEFWNLVGYAVRDESNDTVPHGIVESDSVALACASVEVALSVGRRLFRAVFEQTARNSDKRYWVRGVIVARDSNEPLRRPTVFNDPLQIDLMLYSGDLLDAIATEKSGYRGMRLLVAEELVPRNVASSLRIPVGGVFLIPVKKLRHSGYPGRIATGFRDYLWMASESAAEKASYDSIMSTRLRLASADVEESIHAAATQVVFHEYTAILGSLHGRDKWLKSLSGKSNS